MKSEIGGSGIPIPTPNNTIIIRLSPSDDSYTLPSGASYYWCNATGNSYIKYTNNGYNLKPLFSGIGGVNLTNLFSNSYGVYTEIDNEKYYHIFVGGNIMKFSGPSIEIFCAFVKI